MDTKALEDLVALAEAESFSKAAEKRFVTQPAFSRRIKNLEDWFGVDLVDRSNYPAKLTPAGQAALEIAIKITEQLSQCRQDVREMSSGPSGSLSFGMPHSLSIGFFPEWRTEMEMQLGQASINVVTGNIHDAAQLLESGGCDFVLFYSFDLVPTYNFSEPKFFRAYIDIDYLIPVCAADSSGFAIFDLQADNDYPIPYLSWSPPTLVNHVLAELTHINNLNAKLQVCYQNQLAAAIREEALLGNGLAWLPGNLINNDLETGRLLRAGSDLDVPMNIGIACNSTTLTDLSRKWWEHLEVRHLE